MLDENATAERLKQAQLEFANLYTEILENLNKSLREVLDNQKNQSNDIPTTDEQEDDDWDEDDWDEDDDLDDEPFDTNDISGQTPEKPAPKFKVGDWVRCTVDCGEGRVTEVHEGAYGLYWYCVEAPVYSHQESVLELVEGAKTKKSEPEKPKFDEVPF